MMDWQRIALLVAIAAVSLMLVSRWTEFEEAHRPQVDTTTTRSTTVPEAPTLEAPTAGTPSETPDDVPAAPSQLASTPTATTAVESQLIDVSTDVLELKIDTRGGDIVFVALPEHPVSLEQQDEPLILLNRAQSTVYTAESGLVGPNGTDGGGERPLFRVARTNFQLAPGAETLRVDLQFQQGEVNLTKRYTFRRGDYLVDLEYLVDNQSAEPWRAYLYGQIRRDDHEPPKTGPAFGIRSFTGAATTTAEDNYSKFSFDDIEDDDFSQEIQGGWVAMIQHYFLSAWVPPQDQTNYIYLRQLGQRSLYLLGYRDNQATTVSPGQQGTLKTQFYAGPKDIDYLEQIAPHLELTIDYGWLWWMSKPIFHFLDWIHSYVGNWGWSIVILVLCVKLALFHFSAVGFRGMAKMRTLAPKMQELKERYGDNKQKFSEEMMKLYKKEGANPFSSCLPLLLQMPIFLALYYVLLESVELRQAPWILWIEDLSARDPYWILPIIYAATFWFQQKLNPQPTDPTQAKIMQMLPFVFGVMFLFFPAGLVLYWVVNALLSIAQQYVITKQIENADKRKKGA